jgi:pimeloyl-ACP methyl ester carboxylesterase
MRGRVAALLGIVLLASCTQRSASVTPILGQESTSTAPAGSSGAVEGPSAAVASSPATATQSPAAASPSIVQGGPGLLAGRADIGGYSLAYRCTGKGSPTVLLEAGYTASGIDTFGPAIQPALATTSRVCTYDRAGDGTSDARPKDVTPVTAGTQAGELHALLDAIHVKGPYVVVGHSYGGMVSRAFAARYPKEVVGMVLLDASSEPEIPVYDRLHAGAWVDGSVTPAPNQTIDIHATVRELRNAPSLGAMPLIVVTAGILEDRWLAEEPVVEARAQTRLAGLSTDSIHVLDRGKGHLLPRTDPRIVIVAVRTVVDAVKTGASLPPCEQVFASVHTARCLARGQLGVQQIRPDM